jgi:hypothetical protein
MKRTLSTFLLAALVVIGTAFGAFAQQASKGKQYHPSKTSLTKFAPLNFTAAARAEAEHPPERDGDFEDEIDTPQPKPDVHFGVPIPGHLKAVVQAAPASPTGPSPGPVKTFKAEFLSATSIPPDTMGAVGTTHIVSVSNDRMRIQTRDGIEIARMTLTSFWAGVTIKGAAISAFDPKVMFDRFNNRFILISSGNGQNVNSGAMFAVSATADPTGTWYRWSVPADPASTAAGGRWIDYPTMGFNKNWIVIDENVFNFGTAGTGYWGQQIYVLDKQAAYSNTLATISLFEADFNAVCLTSATPETELACGFTMAPTIVENNTTDEVYLVEDWDSTAAQLRMAKITGTPSAPVLTVGTQFPQSTESWRFNALRLGTANNCGGTCSGGYVPQRQQSANLISGTRIMANDSRVQNAVLRNGKLWCTHTVMLSTTPQAAGVTIGGTGNPIDNHSGIQWWQIDPTVETGGSVAPLQRGRIEDPTANNCHNGNGGTTAVAPCTGSALVQFGEHFAFPNISVNQNEDVLIGFTRFSPFTYPNSGYVIRRAADPANTTRDPVIFRPGQSNYNIGSGSGASRQNRWGDYSASQTDPLNDTHFWSVQEYAGTNRNDFLAPSYAGPWETWWTLIDPAATVPSTGGSLIINEFRLRGPQGVRDEFVDVYNPGATPVIVNTADNSEGWALVYSNNGTAFTSIVAVIPNGTVIKPRGHFLMANNPDNTAGGTSALTYSLNSYPGIAARTADSDVGWSLDLADNGGLALFKTNVQANMTAGTLMDSVGFATIAAGLFKEGAGIPAVTAATPTGQMTFYRNAASGGVPADTGANENDFIFADPVLEVLTATPRVGAAGPRNLDGPIHSTSAATVDATLFDTGTVATAAPNLYRDPTAGPVTTSTFGTITFRRRITNNTGAPLPRLRYRVVDITTNPVTGGNADLRVLSQAADPAVGLFGGGTAAAAGTTLETPPAQAAGGGLNSSLSIPSITFAAPLAAGASTNIAFTAGVQVRGAYNLCLVPEGIAEAAGGPLCFTGNTGNVSITAGGPLARTTGVAATNSAIATVSDVEDAAGSLTVTVATAPTGISITNIVNSGGNVTADVAALCTAAAGANNVVLQVTDSAGSVANATLVVNVALSVTPPVPTIGGPSATCAGVPVILTATSAGATSFQWYRDAVLLGGETASTINTAIAGSYTVTASAGGCASAQSAPQVLTVNPNPAQPTISGTPSFCTGGNTTLTSSSASGNQWYRNGNPLGGETNQSLLVTLSGDYTVQVTDGNSCVSPVSAITTVTENPLPPTPTITPGGPTTFCAGGSVTLTSSSATGNQWYLNGNPIGGETNQAYIATASGNYTVVVTQSGCSSAPSAATSVTVNPAPPTPTITPGGPTTFCAGGSVTLTSSSATGNQWYLDGNPIGGATNQSYIATASGNYTVVVTQSGCSSAPSAATSVTVNPIPATPTITPGGPTTFCAGGSVTLTSSSAAGNQWYLNGNPIGGATNQAYIATASGNYTVVVTTSGCSSAPSAPTSVTVNPAPSTPTITPGGPTTFCAGGSVTLTSSAASGNQWYLNGNPIGGETNQAYIATASGNYTVVVTQSGCSSAPSAATTVTVNPVPSTPTITPGGPTTFCAGGNVTLTSSSGSGNQWYLNGNPIGGATSNTYIAAVAGDYTVVVTTSGCSSAPSSTTTVTINPNPDATITAPGSVATGSTGNLASVANAGGGATYNWSITNGTITAGTGTANITFTAGAAGSLTLNITVTTAAGCSDSDSAPVTVTPLAPAVTVTSVVPNSGSTLGGTNVTINGSGFVNGATVTFGGSAATGVAFVNSGQLTATTPAHAAGAVSVTVTNPDTSNGTLNNGYTYVQQNFDPNGDNEIDPSDIFYLVAYLFTGGPAPAGSSGPVLSGDANGDGVVDPADIFYTVNYLFGSGPAPQVRTPRAPVTDSARQPFSGSLELGQAVLRNGRWYAPVVVTMDANSDAPQAVSLRVRFQGATTEATVRRAAGLSPIFEVNRSNDNTLSYLLAFGPEAPLSLGSGRSMTIAEIEVSAPGAFAMELDPSLTMLVDGTGRQKATVANHALRIRGAKAEPRGTQKLNATDGKN